MKLSRVFMINLLFISAMFSLSIWTWGQLPAGTRVPVHFDITGSPDKYMGKVGLFLMPAIALTIALLNPILPKIEPNKNNLEFSDKAFTAFSIATVVFFSIGSIPLLQ